MMVSGVREDERGKEGKGVEDRGCQGGNEGNLMRYYIVSVK